MTDTNPNNKEIATSEQTPEFDLLTSNPVYKPFRYPWAYDAWLTQQRLHWLPEEVPLADDVKDWHRVLNNTEKNLVTQIFRFFTQADIEVNNCYNRHYSQVFKPTEVVMMLSAFSNIETVHIAAYSHLLDTLGMPEIEYSAFLKYKEMKDKYDYMQTFSVKDKHEIAKTLAAFGAFTEGLQLFASFAILMNFPRFNKLKGMGQIVSWSVRDECYAEGTEILTPRGWVDFSNLTDDDKVAQYDMETKEVSFVSPERRVEYDVDTSLVNLRTDSRINTLVTKAHGVVFYDERKGKTTRIEAEDYVPHSTRWFPISGYKQSGNMQNLSALEQFRIAFSADGTMPDSRHTGSKFNYLRVSMTLKKERKKIRLRSILANAGLEYDEVPVVGKENTSLFRINAPVDISKRLNSFVDLENISSNWGQEFLSELKHWDGHDRYQDGTVCYFGTTDKEDKDIVQAVASLSGYIANTSLSVDRRGYKDYWRIHVEKKDMLRTGYVKKELVPYKGKVRCVTVPTGAVVTRYQDNVVVSGNTLHCLSVIKLFRTFVQENPEIWTEKLQTELREICATIVEHEEAFIDLAFNMGEVEGLNAQQVKDYIHYIADRRLIQLGLEPMYHIKRNPLPWMDDMLNAVEHTNFFENRATEYSRASTKGTWEEAFADTLIEHFKI